jgi:hypothetical protein
MVTRLLILNDETDVKRNGLWAFDILNVNLAAQAAVPEPASLTLMGAALIGVTELLRLLLPAAQRIWPWR